MSALVYKEIVRTHVLDPLYLPLVPENPKGPWVGLVPVIAILVVAVFLISFLIVLKKIGKERILNAVRSVRPSKDVC